MTLDDIAKTLVEIRTRKGFSQYKIWQNGINMGSVRAIESGKNVNIENLLRYCEIVGAEVIVKEKRSISPSFCYQIPQFIVL